MSQEDFEKFEKTILDSEKTQAIKYKVDISMEAAVKYQFLCETYGKDRVQSTLDELNLKFTDIADPEKFKQISEKISQ
jgi:hypothetical protein